MVLNITQVWVEIFYLVPGIAVLEIFSTYAHKEFGDSVRTVRLMCLIFGGLGLHGLARGGPKLKAAFYVGTVAHTNGRAPGVGIAGFEGYAEPLPPKRQKLRNHVWVPPSIAIVRSKWH